MNTSKLKQLFIVAACCALPALPAAAQNENAAAGYPSRPIRWLVPFSPGGLGDTLVRAVGQQLSERLKQPVIVENRAGASQIIAMEATAKAAPDGYTIALASQGGMVLNTIAKKKLPYDPIKDFAPITMLATSPLYVVVHPSLQANSISELIALAKSQPGKLTYASIGNGSAQHLATEMFKSMTGIDIMHVPYRGSGGAITDVATGQVHIMFEGAASSMPYVRQNKLRLLGTTGTARIKDQANVPIVAETVPGYNMIVWFGMVAPAGTPKPIVDRLNKEVSEILRMPAVLQMAANLGVETTSSTPEELAVRIREEVKGAHRIAMAADIKPE
ncbi:tripartite tricarboxylate transporter substrate binding protein [Herbaspirillum sp. GCM10030257]|uniref:tripartite tricarboxylate transporter substrate binding protein n=1 Tax=Herbaspirillum sp. GCM10030257 TaxID=3273393 RepID=UPI003616FC08